MNMKTHVVCPHCNSTNRVATAQLEAELSCGSCHKPLFDKHPASLTSIGLAAQIAKSEVPVVVDFWAPWCGPCRMMAPEYEKACAMLEPHARFVKVDTEEHRNPKMKGRRTAADIRKEN
ncbi:MAG: thiol reductase thioredoxin [Betaproteobacteria bacterium]|nr:thiol reductase thioredoxin [Betaproteobacteria bacterium]